MHRRLFIGLEWEHRNKGGSGFMRWEKMWD